MTIKQMQEKRASLLATAKEQAEIDNGDMSVVKSCMAEAKALDERIEAVKSLGNLAPEPVAEVESKPWKSVDLPSNPFRGATAEERSFKAYAFGKLLQSLTGNRQATKWLESNGFSKAMSGGTDSAGGFSVPDIVSGLIYLREEFGTIRKKCRHVVMTSDTLKVPNASTSTTAYYPNEGAAITASDLALTQITLTAKKLAGVTIHSSELREDSIIEIGSLVAKDLAFSLEKELENALFNGDGTGTYGSITGLLRAVYGLDATKANIAGLVLADTGSVAGTPTLANWRSMVSKLPTYARRPEWYLHKSVFFDAIGTRLDAMGGNAMGDIMNAYGPNPTLYGYPVNFIQNAPSTHAAASTPFAVLADLDMGAYFGDKRDLRVDVSDHIKFLEDSTTFRATMRFGFSAYDVGNVSATASARKAGSIVVMATQAT